jgi:hypothetical protein
MAEGKLGGLCSLENWENPYITLVDDHPYVFKICMKDQQARYYLSINKNHVGLSNDWL